MGDATGGMGLYAHTAQRSRQLQFDPSGGKLLESEEGQTLTLELFPDTTFQLSLRQQASPSDGSYAWSGPLSADTPGEYTLLYREGMLAGSIYAGPRGTFSIVPGPQGTARIIQFAEPALPECGNAWAELPKPVRVPPLMPDAPARRDDGSIIDLMVVYTPEVVRLQGGETATRTMIGPTAEMSTLISSWS